MENLRIEKPVFAKRTYPDGCGPCGNTTLKRKSTEESAASNFSKEIFIVHALMVAPNCPPNQVEDSNRRIIVQALMGAQTSPWNSGKKKSLGVASHISVDNGAEASVSRKSVMRTLRCYQEICRQLLKDAETRFRNGDKQISFRVDRKAAELLKEKKQYVKPTKILGSVPGVEVGDEFHFRVELAIVGLHGPYQSGIDHVERNGKCVASSVVSSGGYEDVMKNSEVLVYTGQGGMPTGKGKKAEDQKLQGGNLALKNSHDEGTLVRVIRGYKEKKENGKEVLTYIYDGLYIVEKYWAEKGCYGTLVYKFQLKRISGQPELTIKEADLKKRLGVGKGVCVHDVSNGNEVMPISAFNRLDDSKPPSFEYIKKMTYPSWCNFVPSEGCDCVDGCSDSEACACAVKNGGELPYNYDGDIMWEKPIVYECGASCRCSQSCLNRVSQRGIKIPLEVFKTDLRGWGVRSLQSIPSGAFICEYTGELLKDEEAEERKGNDEYLFDIGQNNSNPDKIDKAYTIDAAHTGNIGRFINHSCSPNIYAQNVLFDHGDESVPHIMLFAQMNIPPLQELTYDYNYKLDSVRDANGNIKKKSCYCGSDDCSGRLY
ncbi:[histone H3]-lysine(4) N-trimethyltransferase [Ranunculus cassubicifolius]